MRATLHLSFFEKSASVQMQSLGGETYLLHNLWSAVKQQGHGRAVMEKALGYADTHALAVTLVAQQYGNGSEGMNNKQLEKFYKSLGFVTMAKRPLMMIRLPKDGIKS